MPQMDEETSSYRHALLGEIGAESAAGMGYTSTRFVDHACSVLERGEEFTEFNVCRIFGKVSRGWPVLLDAYSFSPSDGVLNLIVSAFSGAEEPEPLLTEEIKRTVAAAFRFLEGSVHESLADSWDESHDAHAVCSEVFSFATGGEMTKACIYLISDRPLGNLIGKMPELALGTQRVDLHLWDIARLARMEASSRGREEITIDFEGEYGEGIPALPAGLDSSFRYESFMCVMPGSILASLYDRFGGKILEQNVRAFLGDNRKVNKGIRDTLRKEPEMFFAFNNGLTVTVSELETRASELGGTEITKATGLQIVNGGQTTASLYWASKAGVDLSKVRVQMKLSRLPEDGFEDAVHNIARFANAQNAVSASDLFAGHPYFKRLEGISRGTLAPPAKSGEGNTYWYFERTSGSYKVELKREKTLEAKLWQMLNPRKQILTKTDVARFESTFDGLPHVVSSGAQKNIAAFGKGIVHQWAVDPTEFDTPYFQRLVGRAILTRAVDADIPAQSWYPGSIVRPLTSYTLALMSSRMHALGIQPAYDKIWRAQRAPDTFMHEAMRVAALVLPLLMEIPEAQVRNRLVTEWVKREACWARIEASEISLAPEFLATCSTSEGRHGEKPLSWKDRAHLLWRDGAWRRLHAWESREQKLTPGERELVEWAALASEFNPKGFRLEKLQESMKHAIQEGFV
ncbi:AIPR family protein [Xanthomonas campestris pv. campestris]|uniref:AIPR family protein n=2 Tax=Xanthomonas campestris TaxID=339 RepID=UPI0023680739|nr:AIPR family protein [Xanthomonas campestris]MDM7676562.1 AIPR family protein [Xanthomonas campestris pv. campestris]MDM7681111.1 AIPR family protein [Xanthomonas campestris pv. campestris]MDM7702097.1 AIPR family protein [Xanthomonas campestris pv. campestris]MDM7722862.1 AIPR family protein [Xanthomonas campestris pv. campestris]MEA0969795.1 AIPR family protein [Xanthomonas campestris pv. campestris]